jgi:site-specific recombinase XerC
VIDSVRDRALFRLAYHVGLRASEIGVTPVPRLRSQTDRVFIHWLKGSHSGHHHLMREEASSPHLPVQAKAAYRPHDAPLLVKKYGTAAGPPKK